VPTLLLHTLLRYTIQHLSYVSDYQSYCAVLQDSCSPFRDKHLSLELLISHRVGMLWQFNYSLSNRMYQSVDQRHRVSPLIRKAPYPQSEDCGGLPPVFFPKNRNWSSTLVPPKWNPPLGCVRMKFV